MSINEKIEFYNEIIELDVKQLNYFLLLFLFIWWETAPKKSKLEKKGISKNEIISFWEFVYLICFQSNA